MFRRRAANSTGNCAHDDMDHWPSPWPVLLPVDEAPAATHLLALGGAAFVAKRPLPGFPRGITRRFPPFVELPFPEQAGARHPEQHGQAQLKARRCLTFGASFWALLRVALGLAADQSPISQR